MGFMGPLLDLVLPVYGLIAAGWVVVRAGVLAATDVPALSRFTFVVFVPALLFRALAGTEFAGLQAAAPAAYFGATLLVFGAVTAWRWRGTSPVAAAVDGLAASFSNTVMIGVPLVALGWGADGVALLVSIIALHSLVMLTTATFLLEAAVAEGAPGLAAARALRSALLSPIILPILLGLGWGATGLALPAAVDATLMLLATAAAPLCLVLLGASLSDARLRDTLAPALRLSALKLLAHPLLAWLLGRFVFGLAPLPLSIVVVTAALPIGANVFLFAQRYRGDAAAVSAAVTLSTLLAAPLLAVLLPLLPVPPR
jgi:malonate transporter